MEDISIVSKDVCDKDSQTLIMELNIILTEITGDDGTVNFSNDDMNQPGSRFLVAYINEEPYGCGAIRRVSDSVAEIKRVYARKNQCGVGRKIIDSLEREAKAFGYSKLVLETRVQNTHAIEFYGALGYQHCEAYGKYVGKQNAYCFEKLL